MKLPELDNSFFLRFAGSGKLIIAEIPDAEADYWLTRIRYQTDAEATNVTEMIPVVKPITGLRRWWIKRRLKRQYRAERRAAKV